MEKEEVRFINKEYLKKVQDFYKKHGSMTIVIGRFIPIIRTFVPFVAGIGEMNYSKFIPYNVIGGGLWVSLFLGGGYFFGNLSFIKNHFSLYVNSCNNNFFIARSYNVYKRKRRKGENNEDDTHNTEI